MTWQALSISPFAAAGGIGTAVTVMLGRAAIVTQPLLAPSAQRLATTAVAVVGGTREDIAVGTPLNPKP